MGAKLVLLHSPLVGPGTWRLLAPLLQTRGFQVGIADFTAAMAGTAPYYPRLVETARSLLAPDTTNFLIVHSGAGSLVPAVAAAGGVAGAVFVDALLPHPGRSWFETVPQALESRLERLSRDGLVPPWHRWWPEGSIRSLFADDASYARFVSELMEIPLAYLREPAPSDELAADFAAAYLQLGPGNAAEASVAEQRTWPVQRLSLHHLAVLTHPGDVVRGIEPLIRSITT